MGGNLAALLIILPESAMIITETGETSNGAQL